MTLDPTTRDLLVAIGEALHGPVDLWRLSAVESTVGRVLDGTDDPGTGADWLRGFLVEHKRAADART